ncbi:MAG TPA: hypothetical protein VF008_13820 [Niastella sp.]
MPKRFDCEEEASEFMEVPCRCDCGNWFDLEDGHKSKRGNKVICLECAEGEKAFHFEDEVIFTSDYYTNGKLRAYDGDKGTIISKADVVRGTVSVKLQRTSKAIRIVSTDYLEKI